MYIASRISCNQCINEIDLAAFIWMAMMAWQHGHPNPAKDFTEYLHGVSKIPPLNRNIMQPTMNLDKLLHIFFIDSPTEIYKQITNPYL